MPPKRKATISASGSDFSKMTVHELKKELKKRNLDEKGAKATLIKRLNDYENKQIPSKKVKQENNDDTPAEEMTMKEKLEKLAQEEKQNQTKRFKVDSTCPKRSGKIVSDYDCMLNQTNVSGNNNKFYVIQLIQDGEFFVWNRWGRVGEVGATTLKGPFETLENAEKEFKKKFKDKTKNNWEERENFKPQNGKYTMIEMDGADSQEVNEMEEKLASMDSVDGPSKTISPCALDQPTQALIKLIFDNDMFKEAMMSLNLDVKKMPLGKLSKSQIAKGFEVLEEIEVCLKSTKRLNLSELSSKFYTLVPHNFGRNRPPTIGDMETLQKKMDMLMVLGDIVVAQTLTKGQPKIDKNEVPHPLDVNYGLLNCGLTHIDKNSSTYKFIENYMQNTKQYGNPRILDVWEVDRNEEDKCFAEHKDIKHRKLLWHGTNIAVVVAILKSGLRIMPHSGGRVGRGIYFASEFGKSSCYVSGTQNGTVIMFLNEVALGKQNVITRDDSSLKKPPIGFDSVLAKGNQEPDESKEIKISLDGNDVIVPQGKPIKTSYTGSSFWQSEYLIYKESQCRIRYMIKLKL